VVAAEIVTSSAGTSSGHSVVPVRRSATIPPIAASTSSAYMTRPAFATGIERLHSSP